MRRALRSLTARMALSVFGVLVLSACLGEWYWTRNQIGTTGPAGDPVYQSAPESPVSNWLNHDLALFPTVEAVAGALLTIALFAFLSWLAGRRTGESRCRACRRVLRGLKQPRCPDCGEAV